VDFDGGAFEDSEACIRATGERRILKKQGLRKKVEVDILRGMLFVLNDAGTFVEGDRVVYNKT
jgi:hypothetical protein